MNYEELFSFYGEDEIRIYGEYSSEMISVEELYQAFADRLLAEIKEEKGKGVV